MSGHPLVYDMVWRNKNLTSTAESIDDMIGSLEMAVQQLREMRDKGVVLDPTSRVGNDLARLITTDEVTAELFDMQPDDRELTEYFEEIGDVEFEEEEEEEGVEEESDY